MEQENVSAANVKTYKKHARVEAAAYLKRK